MIESRADPGAARVRPARTLFPAGPERADMTLRDRMRAREPLVGGWVSLSDPAVAEMYAELAFDFALLDTEHTPNSLETVADQVRAVDAADGRCASVVRVPWNDPVRIKRVLDVGVGGVMVPMVETADEAEEFAASVRYPPPGIRGVAAGRAARYGLAFDEYVREGDPPLTIAQIETESGLANVADIAHVEGLDALFVGPADLSASLGVFQQWDDPAFESAVETVLEAADDADVPVGTLATGDVASWVERGFDYVIAGTDAGHVLGGSLRAKSAAESAFAERDG